MPNCAQHRMCSPGQTYFDLIGDKGSSDGSEETDLPLTWRGDPHDTYSDWTVVVVTNELETVAYHVHKSVMCFGPRSSKYFAKRMLNQTPTKKRSKDGSSPTTKVELDDRDAKNFPIVLDFIYASCSSTPSAGTALTANSTLSSAQSLLTPADDGSSISASTVFFGEEITTQNAVSLRYLARLFEIDALTMAVNRFIQRDLNFETGPAYLSRASEYGDERLIESAQRLCAENFEQMDMKAITKLPLKLFRTVVKELELFGDENRSQSCFLSEVVCRYFEKNPKHLSADLLLELTDPLLMPFMTSEAAIGFTSLIKELDPDQATRYWSGLVSLSRRCAKGVVKEYGWNDFSVDAAVDEYLDNSKQSKGPFSRVDSLLFATSFAAALEQAQDDYEIIVVEQERLEVMVNALHQSVATLEKMNTRKDEHMAKQQWAIEEAKKQILKLKQQIGDMKKEQLKRPPRKLSAAEQQYATLPAEITLSSPVTDPALKDLVSPNQIGREAQIKKAAFQDPAVRDLVSRDLVSPSQIARDIHAKKTKKIKELRTMNEMRSKSLVS